MVYLIVMEQCTKKTKTATSIILLGATGDLAQKKLLSSLMDLFEKGALPEKFFILAFSRDEMTSEEYRAFAKKYILVKKEYNSTHIEKFLNSIEYIQGTFDCADSYKKIKNTLENHDKDIETCSSKLFYLAVPPVFYDTIFEHLASVKLEQECLIGDGWTRILVEKPFGSDLENAKYLEDRLSKLFKEEQIYRIDHYLAKDAIQNIISFRFSNVLFEDKWNNDFIESVYIKVYESFGVANRGAFFDGVGALRDVGQNHMLQMLALIAMDHPEELEEKKLRKKRAEIFKSLKIPTKNDIGTNIIKGQYNGYRDIKEVSPNSKMETYFAIKTYIENDRWSGVPFYLEHGKALSENKTEITIRFRSSKNCVCNNKENHNHPNLVRFTISPEQKITVRFWVRKPGLKYELEAKDLVFDRGDTNNKENTITTEAYEEVLFDAICGDQTLFVSNEEQKASWKYITAILKLWKDVEPLKYEPGSDGPNSELKNEIIKTVKIFD